MWRMHLPLCTRRSPSRRRRLFRHPWCLWRRMSCRALPRSSLQARLVNQLQLHRVPPRPSLLPLTGQCWHTIHTTYVLSSAFWQLRDPPSFPPFPLFFLGYVSLVEMLYFVAHIVRPSLDGHRLIPRFVFAHCPCSHFVLLPPFTYNLPCRDCLITTNPLFDLFPRLFVSLVWTRFVFPTVVTADR